MGHMDRQVVYGDWVEVIRKGATYWINRDDIQAEGFGKSALQPFLPFDISEIDFWDVQPNMFGARLSAPGYLDCTDWLVYETAEEANAALDELSDIPEDDEEGADPVCFDCGVGMIERNAIGQIDEKGEYACLCVDCFNRRESGKA
jgi:hypothetical protein